MRRHRSLSAATLAAPAGLLIVGLVASGCQGGADATDKDATTVAITLTDAGCAPKPAKVDAGPVTFTVTNDGATKVNEAELLRGNTIVGEKENLTPGLSGSFSLTLKAGTYQIYCPNAKTDKSAFTVTGTAAETSRHPAVAKSLDTATSGYHDYVVSEVNLLVPAARKFTDAVRKGDVAGARRTYAAARYHYETIEPVAESFGGLDPRIDARINDVNDPSQWTGFHRIEKTLWQDNTTRGMAKYADQLDTDIARLAKLVAKAGYQPAQLANGATELLNEVASSKITGEEDRYSHTDLTDFEANVVGGKKAYTLLEPALKRIDPTLAKRVSDAYKHVLAALTPYRGDYSGTDYVDYSTVGKTERRGLTQSVDALAEPLSQVSAKVNG